MLRTNVSRVQVSLSEPDVYSYVRWLVSESPTIFAHQDLSDLLRVVTWMYCTRNVILPTSGNKTYEFHVCVGNVVFLNMWQVDTI